LSEISESTLQLLWVEVPGVGTVEMKPVEPGYDGPVVTLTMSPSGEATLTIGEDKP
jgi:hypothetical protein